VLNKACEECKASIDAHKGRLLVKEAARAVRIVTEISSNLQQAAVRMSALLDRSEYCCWSLLP
jgi:hypothetical protein